MATHIPIVRTLKKVRMATSRKRPRILIAGLGNLLLKDDGVGVHAVMELQKDPPPGALVVEVGTAVLDALHLFEDADKILAIDAMQAGGTPGAVYAFGVGDVETAGCQASLHELSLISALRFLPNPVSAEIRILGVEPHIIDYGLDLSPEVQSALPRLTQAARDIAARWLQELSGEPIEPEAALPKKQS
jgi:hydrogenase maturation protease